MMQERFAELLVRFAYWLVARGLFRIRVVCHELEQGQMVCVFPEGFITRTGNLLPFKRGLEKIMHGLNVPIIPIYLDGLWGSPFSFEGGRAFWKWPGHLRHPGTVTFGAPILASSTASKVRHVIQELGACIDAGENGGDAY